MQLSQGVSELERENNRLNQENEELRRLLENRQIKPKNCRVCKFFMQHYVYTNDNQYKETFCGHCVHGLKMKERKPNTKSCQYFELGKGYDS